MPTEFQLVGYLRLFAEHEVDYLIVGGVGARVQGSATTTQDLDIMPEPSPANLERLARALSGGATEKRSGADEYTSHAVVSPMEFRTADVSSFRTRHGLVDVIMDLPGVGGFDVVLRNARRYEWGGTVLVVASLDDIITSKETTDRAKDWRAMNALYEARAHLQSHPDPYAIDEQALEGGAENDTD